MFDKVTKEYTGTTVAYLNKVASRKAGKDIYFMPAYTTELIPPKCAENEVAIFERGQWNIVPDFRGVAVYNLNTRESIIWKEIGKLPKGYTTKVIERIEDVKNELLFNMKNNFNKCLTETKLQVPSTELYFTYGSVERLKKEQLNNIQISRDDNNKIYALTRAEYDVVLNYLNIFGQYMYLQKWALENNIKKCESVELLKTFQNRLDFRVDQRQINNLVRMTPDKRKEYFKRLADNIK